MHDARNNLNTPKMARAGGPRYWRSLDELASDETLLQRLGDEFAPDADVWLDPTSRRNFLRIMGASLALAGITGCNDFPDEQIIPYVNQPESVIPGEPTFYATAMPFCGYGFGALAESHEGRPTKIEGNPDHPATLGAAHVFMQASVLDLYDPDRSRLITHGGVPTSWGDFSESLRNRLEARHDKGKGLRLLTRTITSPTFADQLARLRERFPEVVWHVHDPSADAGCSARRGGAPGQAVYDFSKAAVVLSLDADFMFSDVGSLRYARQFMDGRRREPGLDPGRQKMNRLYVVESTFSLTGSMADHRRAVKPSRIIEVARALAARLGVESAHGAQTPPGLETFIAAVAEDLKNPTQSADGTSGGKVGVVVAGDHHSPELQALAHAMNAALGSVGKAVRYIEPVDIQGAQSLESLVSDMQAGTVDILLILGGNPVYDAPADLPFENELKRLSTHRDGSGELAYFTAHLGSHEDETSFYCQWHLPESHYLETWGDVRAFDGTASVIQPLILPLSPASKSTSEIMEALLGRPDRSGYEAVHSYWQSQWGQSHQNSGSSTQPAERANPASSPKNQGEAKDFEQWWTLVLRKGVIDGSASPNRKTDEQPPKVETTQRVSSGGGNWEVVFRPDPAVWDGQFANNAWLCELPKPFTKLVWDNAALMSYGSARQLGIREGHYVRITHEGRTLDVPILVVPGIPDETLTLTIGYGRTRGGNVAVEGGNAVRGFNAYLLRTAAGGGFVNGAQVAAVGGSPATLVTTRSHHAMAALPGLEGRFESGELKPNAIEHPGLSDDDIELHNRRLVRSATLADFRKDPDWVTRLGGEVEMREKGMSDQLPGRKVHLTIYPTSAADGGWDYSTGHQWAMTIDQTACIGCNACVIACQAENNIPVVGKDQCARQREMHWIRIDDWFGAQPGGGASDPLNDPQVIHMPVPCQHCENAPCELVCPVGATTHSAEGINEMTYNRCIGTRYCSNNCPYKVRRFNFLLYSDFDATRALQYNPEVTVRTRGVMEKCNYCVQRLNRTRMEIEKLTVRLEERAKVMEQESAERARALRDSIPKQCSELLDRLQTACQQACPTEAIIFGDKNQPGSKIVKLKEDLLDYTLLADLTTQPRTSYLARVSNPNPALKTSP